MAVHEPRWAELSPWQHCVLVGALEAAALFDLTSTWRPGSDAEPERACLWVPDLRRAVIATVEAGLVVAVGQQPYGAGDEGRDLTLDELRDAVERPGNWFGPLELLVTL